MKKLNISITIILCLSIMICFSACGSNNGNHSESGSKSDSVKTIDFNTKTGHLKYIDYKYPGHGFYSKSNDDYEERVAKTVILKFKYTNLEDIEKNVDDDFSIKAYQNGSEINSPSNYAVGDSQSEDYKSYNNRFKSLLKDGTLEIGYPYEIADNSTLTVIVTDTHTNETQTMETPIKKYVSKNYDYNKLNGVWDEEGENNQLVIREKEIRYEQDGGSWTEIYDSKLFDVDEDTLYLDDDYEFKIVEKDGKMILENPSHKFVKRD